MSQEHPRRVTERIEFRGEEFVLPLFRKQNEHWGEGLGDQWTIARPGIYQSDLTSSPSHDTILNYYWARIRDHLHGADFRDAQERYLLASLMPVYRSRRSRRVFEDSILGQSGWAESLRTLEVLLNESREEMTDEYDFSVGILGHLRGDEIPSNCRPASPELRQCYQNHLSSLLEEPLQMLLQGQHESAVMAARTQWSSLRSRYSRRAGCNTDKVALDMIAYEGKAAFHHCYSLLWEDLIPQLKCKYHWNDATEVFHKFWHLAPHSEDGAGQYTLFHGHIFGLHPGCGWMLTTSTGQQLMAGWLANLRDQAAYHRVLHGLQVSIIHYALQLGDQRSDRRHHG